MVRLAILLLLALPAYGQVAPFVFVSGAAAPEVLSVVDTSHFYGNADNYGSLTTTINISGSNTAVIVYVVSTIVPDSVKVGSVKMTTADSVLGSQLRLYKFSGLSSGSGVTVGAYNVDDYYPGRIAAISLQGVNQSTPFGTIASLNSSSASDSGSVVVSSASGELVVDGFCGAWQDNTAWTAYAGQTQYYSYGYDGVSVRGFGMSSKAGAASVTMGWETAGADHDYQFIIAVPVKPVP